MRELGLGLDDLRRGEPSPRHLLAHGVRRRRARGGLAPGLRHHRAGALRTDERDRRARRRAGEGRGGAARRGDRPAGHDRHPGGARRTRANRPRSPRGRVAVRRERGRHGEPGGEHADRRSRAAGARHRTPQHRAVPGVPRPPIVRSSWPRGNDRLFRRTCEVVGHAAWADDERFATNQARVAQPRRRWWRCCQSVFATRPAAALARGARGGGGAVLADPHDGRGLRLARGRGARRGGRRPAAGRRAAAGREPAPVRRRAACRRGSPPPAARRRHRRACSGREQRGLAELAERGPGAGRRGRSRQTILDAAPESPYGFPAELFVRRAERSVDAISTASRTPPRRAALEALGDGGTVLDVGAGAGRPACRWPNDATASSRSTVRPTCSRRSRARRQGSAVP